MWLSPFLPLLSVEVRPSVTSPEVAEFRRLAISGGYADARNSAVENRGDKAVFELVLAGAKGWEAAL